MGPAELAGSVLEALSDGDAEALRGMVDPDVVVDTGRSRLEGVEAAAEWVSKRFDHLERRYVAEHTEITGDDTVTVRGLTRYEWRDDPGEMAEESPVCFEMRFREGLLVHLKRED